MSTGATTRREAERALAEFEAKEEKLRRSGIDRAEPYLDILHRATTEARQGKLTPVRTRAYLQEVSLLASGHVARELTVAQWLNEWLDNKRLQVGDSTFDRYSGSVSDLVKSLGQAAQKDLESLTVEQVEAAVARLREGGIRAATANQKLADLRSALEEARHRGILSKNVAKVVKKLPEEDSQTRAPFNLDEVRALTEAADDEWGGFVRCAAYTGLRMSNVAKLVHSNVDADLMVLTVAQVKQRRGSPEQVVSIPIAPPLREWLVAHGIPGKDGRAPVFPSIATLPKASISTKFSRLMKKAGVANQVTLPGGKVAQRSLHSLRHTFVSWLASAEVDREVRKKLAGHRSDRVHEVYTSLPATVLADGISRLPDIDNPLPELTSIGQDRTTGRTKGKK